MKTTITTVTLLGAAGLMAGTLMLTGCASDRTRNMGQMISDREVAGSVEKQLDRDPTYKYKDVSVNVYDGNVQLSGFVQSQNQRAQAAELAAHARGARQVINDILIQPMPTGPATIRNPSGQETGRLLVETNAPPPLEHNVAPEGAAPKQQQQ
jgi:hyperosmotically inducible periplasmic protein